MKHVKKTLAVLFLGGMVALTACKKDSKAPEDEISQATLAKISNLAFSTANVQKLAEGYLVEGDITLSEANLNEVPTSPNLRIAEVEQYRTFNLVTGSPRTITVSTIGNISSGLSNGIDEAISRYNAEKLGLTFVRGGSNGGGTINIRLVNTGQYMLPQAFRVVVTPILKLNMQGVFKIIAWAL
jgi:hypothetical protein